MNDTTHSNGNTPKPRWRRVALVSLLGGLLIGAGATIFAHTGPAFFGGGHCGFGAAGPETAAPRADAMVRFMLSTVDASDEQQTRVAEVVKTAMSDLRPLRDRHGEARSKGAEVLSQPSIDRAALESLRAEHMQLAEMASRRIAQAVADAAEVLTPEQRVALIEHMQQMRSAHRW